MSTTFSETKPWRHKFLYVLGNILAIGGLLMIALNWAVIMYQAGGIGKLILGFTFLAWCTPIFPFCAAAWGGGWNWSHFSDWVIFGVLALLGWYLVDKYKD
jgi:hypothetical protein